MRVISPTIKETLTLKILILLGVLSLFGFLFWFVDHISIGQPVSFWLLCFAMLFRVIRVLGEWYHYFHLRKAFYITTNSKQKSVDILTTYFPGEPKEMIKNTLLAMKRINYPHKNFLCDEANDEELKSFCNKNEIKHITRDSLKDAKAGNINNALIFATGEFCFILDPDHVPHPKLLDKIIPQFDNTNIGFVQIVQGYYNNENSFIAKGAAQQTYQFYGPVMMAMNQLGTVQVLGANCCFRREALDSIGGHAAGLAEDLHTSMLLHAKGWKSRYIPEVLTKGLVPEDYHGYLKQQLKWSKGSFDLFFRVFPKIFTKLTFHQKLHYFVQPQYYLFGVVNLIEILIPIFSLLFFFIPWKIDILDFSIALFPFISFSVLINSYVQNWVLEENERGFHIVGGILRNATWFIYVMGLIYSVLNIDVKYLPTPKEKQSGNQIKLIIPNLLIASICLFSIIYGLNRDLTPFSLFMAGFAFTNFILLGFSSLLAFPGFNFKNKQSRNKSLLYNITHEGKKHFWIIRHGIYRFAREKSIYISIVLIVISFSFLFFNSSLKTNAIKKINAGDFFMLATLNNNDSINFNTKILTIDLDSIIRTNKLGWPNTNKHPYLQLTHQNPNKTFIEKISNGDYDVALSKIFNGLKEIEKQFFITIKLNDEIFDLTKINTQETSLQLNSAWDHLQEIYNENNCYNAIWVWPYLKKQNGEFLMPNSNNYDWLSIDIGEVNSSGFLNHIKITDENILLKPIIIDETDIKTESLNYLELKKNSADLNIAGVITENNKESIFYSQFKKEKFKRPKQYPKFSSDSICQYLINIDTLKGICYDPYDLDFKGKSILSKKNLDDDFDKISSMGANFIRIYDTNIYFRNILSSADNYDLKLMVGVDIPGNLDFHSDEIGVGKLQKELLKKIKKYNDEDKIVFWNLGDDVFGQIEKYFAKPYSSKVKKAYLLFLSELADKQIRVNPSKNYVFSISFSMENIDFIMDHVDLISPNLFIGLNVFYEKHFEYLSQILSSNDLKSRVIITAFGPDGYWDSQLTEMSVFNQPIESSDFQKGEQYVNKWNSYLKDSRLAVPGGFAYRWKEHPKDLLTWMGINTVLGTKKFSYVSLTNLWLNQSQSILPTQSYNLVYNGLRIIPYIGKASFFIAKNGEIMNFNERNKLQVNWVFSNVSKNGGAYTQFLGQHINQKISAHLASGQYRMYAYISDSSGLSISLSAPFVIYRTVP